MEHMFCA